MGAGRRGLDRPELALIEFVWWVNRELLFHAGEAWFVRDLYAARMGANASPGDRPLRPDRSRVALARCESSRR